MSNPHRLRPLPSPWALRRPPHAPTRLGSRRCAVPLPAASPHALQYDTDVTTWSPQGRIFQIEYAMEAVKQGSAAVGLKVWLAAVCAVCYGGGGYVGTVMCVLAAACPGWRGGSVAPLQSARCSSPMPSGQIHVPHPPLPISPCSRARRAPSTRCWPR